MVPSRPKARRPSRSYARPARQSFRPFVEALEERVLLDAGLPPQLVPPPIDTSVHIVNNLYQILLSRTPQQAEVNQWVVELQKGLTPGGVAQDFLGSPEYLTNLIREGYETWLGREPEPQGAATWLAAMQAGLTGAQFTAGVLASPEYLARHGGSRPNWVSALYHDALGRDSDPAGLTLWAGLLQAGTAPGDIARDFVTSGESHAQTVSAAYWQLLGRPPDGPGVTFWQQLLDQGMSGENLLVRLAGSPEFLGGVPLTEIDVTFSLETGRGIPSSQPAGVPAAWEASCPTTFPSSTRCSQRATGAQLRCQRARCRAAPTATSATNPHRWTVPTPAPRRRTAA
jgi:hypothetical protein